MQNPDEIAALAQRFFDAIEDGDIDTMRASFRPDAIIWHNTDECDTTVDHTAMVLGGMVARIKNRKYDQRRLAIFDGGFVQQHVLTGNRIFDDGPVRLPCAIICQVEDGKITRLDEYFDSAHVAEFRKTSR